MGWSVLEVGVSMLKEVLALRVEDPAGVASKMDASWKSVSPDLGEVLPVSSDGKFTDESYRDLNDHHSGRKGTGGLSMPSPSGHSRWSSCACPRARMQKSLLSFRSY